MCVWKYNVSKIIKSLSRQKSRIIIVIQFCILIPILVTGQPFEILDVTAKSGSSGFTEKKSRILGPVGTTAFISEYGGWNAVNVGGTGFFRTEKMNDTWYLVDPDGNLFISMGPNSVKTKYDIKVPDDLWLWGINSLGNWSLWESINKDAYYPMPYFPRWNFLQGYKNTSQRGKDFYNKGVIPVFDPEFKSWCDQFARQIASIKDDPYCIGIFSDNELPIYDNDKYGKLLDRYLKLPEDDPNYIAADLWMKDRKGENYSIATSDREEFHGYVAGTYYRIVGKAIKKVDPNHLYMGSRLHGAAKYKPSIFREAGKYVDVISVNYYSRWDPERDYMQMWLDESDKPFIITEFYAKAYDVGLSNSTGAGYKVPTQKDRAIYFENFVIGLLESRGCVGYHWHRYDDSETTNHGFINKDAEWYMELMESFFKVAKDVYHLRNFLMDVPENKSVTLYDESDFDGFAVSLPPGKYTRAQLGEKGINDDTISSLKVKAGAKIVVYWDDLFKGNSLEISENLYSLAGSGFDDQISSLEITDENQTGITEDFALLEEFRLYPNYPNPFNPETVIRYYLPVTARVRIVIYDVMGRQVRTLVDSQQTANDHEIKWDARNERFQRVAGGIYICDVRINTAGNTYHKQLKMLLLK